MQCCFLRLKIDLPLSLPATCTKPSSWLVRFVSCCAGSHVSLRATGILSQQLSPSFGKERDQPRQRSNQQWSLRPTVWLRIEASSSYQWVMFKFNSFFPFSIMHMTGPAKGGRGRLWHKRGHRNGEGHTIFSGQWMKN